MQKRQTPNPEGYNDRSPKGFALRKGISLSTVYNEMRSGRLQAKKIGTSTYISEKAEQDWEDSLPPFVPVKDRDEKAA